jgi:hypothetical protein
MTTSRLWYGGQHIGPPMERVGQTHDQRLRQNIMFTNVLVDAELMCRCGSPVTHQVRTDMNQATDVRVCRDCADGIMRKDRP